jgi:hypothetical protein
MVMWKDAFKKLTAKQYRIGAGRLPEQAWIQQNVR